MSHAVVRSPRDGGLHIRLAGDSTILIEFGETISAEVNDAVHALDAAIDAASPTGLVETVPTYRSLLVLFDPVLTEPATLVAHVAELAAHITPGRRGGRRWVLPACFGGEAGIDLDEVAGRIGLAPEEVVRRHCATDYSVYMIGFSPGFAYLGGLPAELRLPRREDPRLSTPAGSIMQGGDQAAISPLAMPSGWHLLGRTPVRVFDPRRGERPFLLAPGDRVRFEAIGPERYTRLAQEAEAGPFLPEGEPLS